MAEDLYEHFERGDRFNEFGSPHSTGFRACKGCHKNVYFGSIPTAPPGKVREYNVHCPLCGHVQQFAAIGRGAIKADE